MTTPESVATSWNTTSWENSTTPSHFGPPPESTVRARDYRGLWVALNNCTFDPVSKKPVEGDIVDSDRDFSALSARMRERGLCACAIVFCDDHLLFENCPHAR